MSSRISPRRRYYVERVNVHKEDEMIKHLFVELRRRYAAAVVGGACLAASMIGTSFVAMGQNQSAGAPADIILARKTLMSVIARNMYPLDEMIYTGKINLQ